MSTVDYRSKIVESALSYLGTQEPSGDDQFITAYNKYANATFSTSSTPWCAIFVTFNARMVGVPTSVIPNFASCSYAINNFFKPKGLFKTRGSYTPQAGDLIFYDWDLDSNPNHVGIVTGVSSGKVNTIEGNTKGTNGVYGVWKKSYVLTSKYILGYAVPNYGTSIASTSSTTTTTSTSEAQLSSSVKGTYINKFRAWLNSTYSLGIAATGSANSELSKAAIKAWQTQMNADYKTKLEVDGIFGPASRSAANNSKRYLKSGSKGKLVYVLQGCLYSHGYDPKGFDGIFGAGCKNAVQAIQKARSLEVDGVVGSESWESILTKW